jgi:hypothetical protein
LPFKCPAFLLVLFFTSFGYASSSSHTYIVVVDVSGSRNKQDLGDSKQFLNTLVNGLSFGDKVIAIQMQQQGLNDHPRRWSVVMPDRQDTNVSRRDSTALESKEKGIRLVLPTFFLQSGPAILHTDILSTLQIVSEYMRDDNGRPTTIVLLSDMLQSAGGIEMNKALHMPPDNYIKSHRTQGLLPLLSGACVVVVGADPTSQAGVQVRSFWQSFFANTGAHLSANDYRFTPPASMGSVCK